MKAQGPRSDILKNFKTAIAEHETKLRGFVAVQVAGQSPGPGYLEHSTLGNSSVGSHWAKEDEASCLPGFWSPSPEG